MRSLCDKIAGLIKSFYNMARKAEPEINQCVKTAGGGFFMIDKYYSDKIK